MPENAIIHASLAAYRFLKYHSLKQMGLVLLSSSTRPTTFRLASRGTFFLSFLPAASVLTADWRCGRAVVVAWKVVGRVEEESNRRAASTAAWTDYLGYATIAASAIGLVGIVWSSYQQK
jgi:hypothetical protein